MAFTISVEAGDTVSASSQILALLEQSNEQAQHARNARHFCATLRGPNGSVEGGVTAQSFWGWLYIVSLAIEPACRGQGHGRTLMNAAEAWGAADGCHDAWLMTMSFQARGFYERLGYVIFAELPAFPESERRLFMRKALMPPEADNDARTRG